MKVRLQRFKDPFAVMAVAGATSILVLALALATTSSGGRNSFDAGSTPVPTIGSSGGTTPSSITPTPEETGRRSGRTRRNPAVGGGSTSGGGGSSSGGGGVPPAPRSERGSGDVGYLGCSQTTGAVEGYHDVGGTQFWPNIEYGGGGVNRWASSDNDRYWGQFQDNYDKDPAPRIWWQICVLDGNVDSNYQQAQTVLSDLRSRVRSGTLIFVSAQNGYVAPHQCDIGPSNGPEIAQGVVDRLVTNDGVLAGPKMTDLRGPDSAGSGPNQLVDSCHPNDAGKVVLGHDLLDFFG